MAELELWERGDHEDAAHVHRLWISDRDFRAVRTWGLPAGSSPRSLVVIFHGYGEHTGRYDEVARQLVDRRHAVMGLDMGGHGLSGGERSLIEELDRECAAAATAVEAVQERWDAPVPLVLLGHSLGGLSAVRFAQQRSCDVAAMVLSAPAIGDWSAPGRLIANEHLRRRSISPALLSRSAAARSAYLADPLVWHGGFRIETAEAIQRALDVTRNADLGATAVLWVHGTEDKLVPIREVSAAVRGFRCQSVQSWFSPGGLHELLQEDERTEVFATIAAFLDRHTGDSGEINSGLVPR